LVPVRLGQIEEWCKGQLERGDPQQLVTGISTDSRTIKPGCVFIALKGPRFDGHDFVAEVFRKKAVAAVVRKDFPFPDGSLIRVSDTTRALGEIAEAYRKQFHVELLGITGSSGKTTTREIVTKILSGRYNVLASQGNFNNEIGLPLTLLQLQPCHKFCLAEMGINHPGEMQKLCRISHPTSGLITAIGWAHAGFFKSLKQIALSKGQLLVNLEGGRLSFLNADAPYYPLLKDLARGSVFSFGVKNPAHLQGYVIKEDLFSFVFKVKNSSACFQMNFWNPHWIYAGLAGLAVGLAFGIPEKVTGEVLAEIQPLPGRGQVWKLNGITVIDESYNSNPDALLQSLVALTKKRVPRTVAILGDMAELGRRSAYFHVRIGRMLKRLAPGMVFLIGENMLYAHGTAEEKSHFHFSRLEDCLEVLPGYLQEGDLVLIKGSRMMGMERIVSFLKNYYGGNYAG